MQELCKQEEPLCRCIHWGDEDFDVEVHHLIEHFEFLRMELEYSSLEPGASWRLCRIGRCRCCGGRLCVGTSLTVRDTPEDTVSMIHLIAEQEWRSHAGNAAADSENFRELFVHLFHEDDRETVRDWLSRRAEQEV